MTWPSSSVSKELPTLSIKKFRGTRRASLGKQAKWVMGALGIVLAYFGAFGVLMYPVIQASTHVA